MRSWAAVSQTVSVLSSSDNTLVNVGGISRLPSLTDLGTNQVYRSWRTLVQGKGKPTFAGPAGVGSEDTTAAVGIAASVFVYTNNVQAVIEDGVVLRADSLQADASTSCSPSPSGRPAGRRRTSPSTASLPSDRQQHHPRPRRRWRDHRGQLSRPRRRRQEPRCQPGRRGHRHHPPDHRVGFPGSLPARWDRRVGGGQQHPQADRGGDRHAERRLAPAPGGQRDGRGQRPGQRQRGRLPRCLRRRRRGGLREGGHREGRGQICRRRGGRYQRAGRGHPRTSTTPP